MATPPENNPFRFSLMDMLLVLTMLAIAAGLVKLEIGFLAIIAGLIAVIFGLAFVEVSLDWYNNRKVSSFVLLSLFLVVLFALSMVWSQPQNYTHSISNKQRRLAISHEAAVSCTDWSTESPCRW